MADKTYALTFKLSDGSAKSVQFTTPQGEKGESGVYTLAYGETIADAPEDANVVIDPYSEEECLPSGGVSSLEDLLVTEILPETSPEWSADDGCFVLSEVLDLTVGGKYIVNLNGVDYPSTAYDMDDFICMFNDGVDLETGEGAVFTMQVVPGYGTAIALMDGSTTLTISIKGIGKIPTEYLPTHCIVNLTRDDAGTWTADKTYSELVAKVAEGVTPMAVIKNFGYQNETVHVPFAVVEELGMVFNKTAFCVPFKENNDAGIFVLTFMIAPDGTVTSIAYKVNASPQII